MAVISVSYNTLSLSKSSHKMVMLADLEDEIESIDLESRTIRRRRRHEILFDGCCILARCISSFWCFIYQFLRKCKKTEAFLVVLEIVSFTLAAFGKNKWDFLLVACLMSLLACVTTIMLYARRSTAQLAEKILMVVEIGFTLIQFVTTLIYFGLAIMHIRIGFKESVLPLYFALTRYVFSFISSSVLVPGDTATSGDSLNPETRTTRVTNPQPPTSQTMLCHELTGSSSCEPLSSTAASTIVDIHEGPNPSGSATQMPATDNEAKVDDPLPNFKSVQLVAKMGGSTSGRDLNYTDSSSCVHQQLSSGHFTNDPIGTTTVHTHEPLSHAQMDPTDNEANGNECQESYVNSERA